MYAIFEVAYSSQGLWDIQECEGLSEEILPVLRNLHSKWPFLQWEKDELLKELGLERVVGILKC